MHCRFSPQGNASSAPRWNTRGTLLSHRSLGIYSDPVRVYVINLKRRPDRLERVTERFAAVGVGLTIHQAFDREELAAASPDDLIVGGLLANWKSHQELLDRIADSRESHALIVEDDAVPSGNVDWPRLIHALPQAMAANDFGFLQVGFVSWQYGWTRPGILERARLALYRSSLTSLQLDTKRPVVVGSVLSGAHAYVVSCDFARRMSRANDPCWTGSDGLWMRMASMSGWAGRFPVMARLRRSIVEQESRSGREASLDTDVCN